MPIGSPQWMYSAGPADQDFGYSLRFNDDDTAKLSWTPSSAGNRKTWTWSGWVKRGNLGTSQRIFDSGAGNANMVSIFFSNADYGVADTIWIGCDRGSRYVFAATKRRFRDTSAWYHIVFAFDTTQGTATNRTKLYVNGELIDSSDFDHFWDSAWSSVNQNEDWGYNNTEEHTLGARANNTNYLDGYLAEVHSIDGTALTPTSFGETGDYGEWKPKTVSGLTYGTNGYYLSFAGGGIMAATGGTITTVGDYKVHSFTADGTFTPTSVPSTLNYVEYLVIAGGGGGGHSDGGNLRAGGGGGAGGYRTGTLAVTAQAYSITVGDGGAGASGTHTNTSEAGENSVFSSITSTGGGGGKGHTQSADTSTGGSGGGGSWSASRTSAGSASPAGQGNAGGTGGDSHPNHAGGGGGGAGAAGSNANSSIGLGGNGGAGLASSITGSSVTRAGGGGGAGTSDNGEAGSGGGGAGQTGTAQAGAQHGTANTGGGGGGASDASDYGGNGGSGIVILRYKFK